MDTFAPDFSRFFLAATGGAGVPKDVECADDDLPNQAALQALANLVNAARSIV